MNFSKRRNINRGYRNLWVWKDAIKYYKETNLVLKDFNYRLNRIASNQLASVDSIHRNIAEGYCRKSKKEYLRFLSIAKGSIGESVSGWHAYFAADHISNEVFQSLDALSYKIENGLIKLIKSITKKSYKEWQDDLIIKESNAIYKNSYKNK